MTTAAIYLRISKDKGFGTESEGLAVDRQRKDILKMLARKGWDAGPEYLENDTSASGKVPRPQYERMLKDFEAGEIDAIAAWDLDRLWRVPMEFEHLLNLSKDQGLQLATVGGDADLSTEQGKLFARIKVAVAQSEMASRSARQKAKFAQDREAGRNHWRGRRPFGLTLEGELVPVEAQALREIAESILDGGTISSAVKLLNDRGILTTFDNLWERQPLRRTLLNPRIAGLLEHEGELLPGNWEAVLDEDTWRAVGNVLKTPGRAKPKLTGREYFLSGLLTCEQCGGPCYGTRARSNGKKVRDYYVYRCAKAHTSKTMQLTDDIVIMRTLSALMDVGTKEVEADRESLKALREARAALVKDWSEWMKEAVREKLRPSDVRSYREAHESELAELDRKITDFEKVSLVRLPTAEEEGEGIVRVFEWDSMSLEKRRRLVETVWESITLKKTRKGARWSNENVVMVPRKL